jgi:neutral ceramidase
MAGAVLASTAAAAAARSPSSSEAASSRPEPRRAGGGGALTAGAARVEFKLPPGTPLGGYGSLARRLSVPDVLGRHRHAFWFRPHAGERDRLAARALVLEGDGRRVVWVAADLIGVDRGLTADLARRLGVGAVAGDALILSASHTHSGPGAFSDSALMGFVALDRGDAWVRSAILDAMAAAARQADRARAPARIGTLAVPGPDVTKPRLGEAVDHELTVMKVTGAADRRPIALLWNFAVHGTMLGARNLRLSGDVMGVASAQVEATVGVPVLFVNGAVGDVTPRRRGEAALAATAEQLARAVEQTARGIQARDATPPVVARERVSLGAAALTLRHCVADWIPDGVRVPLGRAFPTDAMLVAVRAGDTAWVTMPGELQSALGLRIKQAARGRVAAPFVAGLSNDYLGYFVRREDWGRVSYVTCASLYGAGAGERLADTAARLLDGVTRRASGPGAAAGDGRSGRGSR